VKLSDVRQRVLTISWADEGGDHENAHCEEDALLREVLVFIASGDCPDPADFAEEALRANERKNARWYS
jgi:hypothetical protein